MKAAWGVSILFCASLAAISGPRQAPSPAAMRTDAVTSMPAAASAGASAQEQASAGALLAAAFAEFAKAGNAYAELHHKHLGVTQPAPDSSTCSAWPSAEQV